MNELCGERKILPGFAQADRRGRQSSHVLFVALLVFCSSLLSAQTLTGTVKNATTGKPAVGDDVVLLSLGQGMEETGRTKTDAKGNFSFKLDNGGGPHLVRAIHQDVTYHRMAPPGTTSVQLDVYDVGSKIEGVTVVADIMRIQADQGQMDVMRAFAVQNSSKPPRTQMNERNLEFVVPAGAKIIQAEATTQNGNPLNVSPVPEKGDNTRYGFNFPLRPGITQFEVEYELPYAGSANVDPKSLYPLQHFVAIVPKAMQFMAAPGTNYQPMNDPQQPDATVQVASGATVGSTLAFKVVGQGTLQARGESGGQEQGGGPQAESRPGGGLGPPIDAPPPTQKYQWWILGGLAATLTAGGIFVASQQQATQRKARAAAKDYSVQLEEEDITSALPASRRSGVSSGSPAILDALKEELFQLEIERQEGRISQQEYEESKAALDHTLQRALRRESVKPA